MAHCHDLVEMAKLSLTQGTHELGEVFTEAFAAIFAADCPRDPLNLRHRSKNRDVKSRVR